MGLCAEAAKRPFAAAVVVRGSWLLRGSHKLLHRFTRL